MVGVLVAGTNGAQLYVSTDYGVTWTARASGQFRWSVAASANGEVLYATVDTGAVWVSTDSGRARHSASIHLRRCSANVLHQPVESAVDHLPYDTVETINARSGVHTPRSTLA